MPDLSFVIRRRWRQCGHQDDAGDLLRPLRFAGRQRERGKQRKRAHLGTQENEILEKER